MGMETEIRELKSQIKTQKGEVSENKSSVSIRIKEENSFRVYWKSKIHWARRSLEFYKWWGVQYCFR